MYQFLIGWKKLISTYMVKVGIIGKGSFGKKIISKLERLDYIKITWILDSSLEWWLCGDVDWVVIATPNEFHYEQAKHFLNKKINVFCEKPGSLSLESLDELINLSKENNVKFYIDDVLYYEKPIMQTKFVYKKWGGNEGNIIDRIAYHHFYLLYNNIPKSFKNLEPTVSVSRTDSFSHLIFRLFYTREDKYEFEYNLEWYSSPVHNIEPTYKGDALKTMLDKVLSGTADYDGNHYRSQFATRISKKVKNAIFGNCNIVGGGIYGTTAAIKLALAGYNVNLYEKEDDILTAASNINQYRVHKGYHYPRSKETIASCSANEVKFRKFYKRSILDSFEHFYSISSEHSLTTPLNYLKVLDEFNLEWEVVDSMPGCDLTVKVKETLYDPVVLKDIIKERLVGTGVNVFLGRTKQVQHHTDDINIVACYASMNEVLQTREALFAEKTVYLDELIQDYQFELCEKPVFKLPNRYKNKSIVIMDGPFMCFDPYSNTDYHVAGNVVHAIHTRTVGTKPEIPPEYKEYINKGLIKDPKLTNVSRFIESAKKYFPEIDKAEHIGSMYTIRTVLPNRDSTDERPTIIRKKENNFILFSGKVGNCVKAAEDIVYKLLN